MPRLLALLLLATLPAHALESAPATTPHASVSLISATDSVAPGQALRLGIRFRLAPGWHTYWLNPGDAGAAPALTLSGAAAGPLQFPVPARFVEAGLVSYAYTGDVVLPFTAAHGGGAADLAAHLDYLVCAQVCIPETADVRLSVPAGSGAPGPDAPLLAQAIAALPRPSPFPATIAADGVLRLAAPGLAPQAALFLPAAPGVIDQAAPQPLRITEAGPELDLKPLAPLKAPLAGVLVLTDAHGGQSALEIEAPIAASGAMAPPAPTLLRAVVLALAGGLLLNLMPCVLPVLAMKAAALARLGAGERAEVRREAALYVLGVLAAFAAIGAIILGLGAAGHAVGWGVQFQSAVFTTLTLWLMLLVGLNFLGWFEIGTSLGGLGALARHGSFLTGVLAVAVATPCTGPFMATALAAAAVLPPLAGFLIFLALGAGLAAPYALLALVPAAARLLPRPGRWMLMLRQVLALPMLAAAAFFAWVVFQQAGWFGLIPALLGGALLAGAARLTGAMQRGTIQPGAQLAIPVAAVIALFQVLPVARAAHGGPALATFATAERFSPARLAELRAQRRPVLVDMSAAWCITCLVNERVALAPEAVRHAMAKHGAVLLRGDWTREDPAITAYLRQWGRTGVPLYVFYPVEGAPEVLPQILTEADILGRLGA